MKRIPIDRIEVGTHRRPLRGVKELAASIEEVGLLNPITVRMDGPCNYRLVAGYHRLEACKAIGWLEIDATIVDLNDLEAELAEIDENLVRQDLTVPQRIAEGLRRKDVWEAIYPETKRGGDRTKTATPDATNGDHEQTPNSGVCDDNPETTSTTGKAKSNRKAKSYAKDQSAKTGRSITRVYEDVQVAKSFDPSVLKDLAASGITIPLTTLKKIGKESSDDQRLIADRILAGEKPDAVIKAVRSEARSGRVEVTRAHAAENANPECDNIIVGNFIEACDSIPDDSVDLIFTDPPYDDGSVPLYGDLARIAARILKPGGSLIAYVGHHAMPNVLNLMTPHLRFWWTLAVHHNGNTARLPGKWVYVHWKPMLWFVKGGRRDNEFIADYIESKPTDKALHDWQQDTTEAAYYIEHLTMPGDTVLDPFCGSGTTVVAALSIGRKATGIEIDPERASVAKGRINGFTSRA